MKWWISHRADQVTRRIADRHYNRQKIGSRQFVPPGRCMVLKGPDMLDPTAFWVTSWPFAEYVKHNWGGAWICSAFRNEGSELSSELILDAVAATRWKWPEVPELGMITFVDERKIKSRNPGYCYLRAGFTKLKERTKKDRLVVLQMLPGEMPEAMAPRGMAGVISPR